MKEEVKRWMDKSKRDLTTAKNSLKSKDYYAASFWCQQSAEKAFKALLINRENKFPKIHDLTKLARLAHAPGSIIGICAKINPAYTSSRYPDVAKDYTKEEVKLAIDYSSRVLKWVKRNLNS